MALFRAKVRYRYGSGATNNYVETTVSALQGNSESFVATRLKQKHGSVSNLQICIVEIKWL